ncbi:MAG: serine hydrolase [Roseiflexaceae bacterium]|nr:serine hydrolase [Roseiflexaceae bacterium]
MTATGVASLPRATPESQGVDTAAIAGFVQAAEQTIDHLHSFMLLRDGHVIAEGWWHPYAPERPHLLFSLSKSFTSTAVGIAIDEGLLTLDDAVISFFPEETPAVVSENLAALRVRHLLSMSVGQATEPIGRDMRQEYNWAKMFLHHPIEFQPGTQFLYNSIATYMLSAIVQGLTGQTLTEYLRPRLFDPLGIEHADWQSCPRGINVGGWGLSITTDAIARFGQLYLQQGQWQGRQLIVPAWIAQATTQQISNGSDPNSDWAQGYGFQFWCCRHNAYRGDGAFGQYCVVMPDQNAILAVTAGLGDMQPLLNLVWEHLLPALGSAALPENPAQQHAFTQHLAELKLPFAQGNAASPTEAHISGKIFVCAANEQQIETIRLDFDAEGATLTIRNHQTKQQVACGRGDWRTGTTTLYYGEPASMTSAVGVWQDESYIITLCYVETPFVATIRCHFDGDQLQFSDNVNYAFGPTNRAEVTAQAGG